MMDFAEGLTKSDGYDVIMVVVDRLTKYTHFVPLLHPFNATQVASDHARSSQALAHDYDGQQPASLHLVPSPTDGQSERVNECLEMYLRSSVHDTPWQWCKWLPTAKFLYNTTNHLSVNCSMFKALYSKELNRVLTHDG